ncbi:MAG: phosphatidate cytidylyltransferase [Dechloromonas sp.]|uniref:phosphatidate cytidylyltransferase n=1 Tax=Azonexus hydrophilus TaxID=418702 RepID=UPI00041F6728|nr:phosphatidate cytidylyltransferase [Azonexus hydrophilus]MBS4017071.1 phosphatidate cytidylyltransferase [Dechloromonas sp.]
MLKTRVITALALMAVLLPSLFWLPQMAWAWLIAAFIGVGAWEWGALLGWQNRQRVLLGVVTAALCAVLAWTEPLAIGAAGFAPAQTWVFLFYGLSALFWLLLIPFWLRGKWSLHGASGLLVGAVVLLPTWLAMVQLRAVGPAVLLAVFAVVWMADIAAYFAGRRFGKRKLAPSISPGKTWEGAYGAILGVLVYGLVIGHFFMAGVSLPLWVAALLLVTAVSIIGDLFESMLKRKAGIKDSSNVLPGHGGVLDRIDSLTSTLPVAALAWLLFFYRG